MKRQAAYQGYTNYETWAVALWIANDRGSYEYWRENAEMVKEEYKEDPSAIEPTLADMLRDHFEELNPLEEASVYTDLLNAALEEVNWDEVAEEILAE